MSWCWVSVAQSLIFCVVFCRSLYVLFLSYILPVLHRLPLWDLPTFRTQPVTSYYRRKDMILITKEGTYPWTFVTQTINFTNILKTHFKTRNCQPSHGDDC